MTISKIIKKIIDRSPGNRTNSYIAEYIGISPQTFSNKLYRNSFTAEEFLKIVDACDYDIELVARIPQDLTIRGEDFLL